MWSYYVWSHRRTCHLYCNSRLTVPGNETWRDSYIHADWDAEGGAGHHVDAPDAPEPPKTPFELACENKCDVIKAKECCICMEALGEKNTATTACGHQFHFGCLAQHTSTSNNCPMCRAVICPEMPKRELKLPSERDIAAYGARALQPMVSIMNELSVGSQTDRHLVAEGVAMLVLIRLSYDKSRAPCKSINKTVFINTGKTGDSFFYVMVVPLLIV